MRGSSPSSDSTKDEAESEDSVLIIPLLRCATSPSYPNMVAMIASLRVKASSPGGITTWSKNSGTPNGRLGL
eukprot:12415074-Karenia_brevis.AAC.1